jgi:putative ABC transport system permease protein
LLTESVLLAAIAGALGVFLASIGIDALLALRPEKLPRLDEIRVDPLVLGFTVLVSLISGLLVGLIPALQSSKTNLNESLKEGGRGTRSAGRRRSQSLLVATEIAVSVVLLIGAGLMLKSFVRLLNVSPGFDPKDILTVQLSLPGARYDTEEKVNGLYRGMLEKVRAISGVEAAGIGISLPPNKLSISDSFTVEGTAAESGMAAPSAAVLFVSPDYFRALGVPILRGRDFTEGDRVGSPMVGIINDTLARRYFHGENPVGKRMKVGGSERPTNQWFEIVGVVGDLKFSGLDEEAEPAYYQPHWQSEWSYTYLVLRTRANQGGNTPAASLVGAVRDAVWSLDKDLPLADVQTMEERVSGSVGEPRFRTVLLGVFGGLALLLAAIGIYSVTAYTVTQRTREIGIRRALGASSGVVEKLVVRQGMVPAIAGIAAGLIGAFLLTEVMAKLLFEVTPTDLPTFVSVPLILAAVALVACYIPARRATRVDPMIALRSE